MPGSKPVNTNKEYMKSWYVLVNGTAGNGAGSRNWKKIARRLGTAAIDHEMQLTSSTSEVPGRVYDALQRGYRRFAVAGGDGSINHLINALFTQDLVPAGELKVALLPLGTGNDWLKTHGIGTKMHKAIKYLHDERFYLHDIGYIDCHAMEGTVRQYFINIAGFGFDGQVVKRQSLTMSGFNLGAFSYLYIVLASLFGYQAPQVEISTDRERLRELIFSMNVAICCYSGGGMQFGPRAVPNDGLFDLTLIRKIAPLKIVLNLHRLFTGSYVKQREVSLHRGQEVEIRTPGYLPAEVDGEMLPVSNRYTLGIIPRAIEVVSALASHEN